MLCVCFRVTSKAQQLALNSRQPPAVPLNWDNTAPLLCLAHVPVPTPLSQAETLTALGSICDSPVGGDFFVSTAEYFLFPLEGGAGEGKNQCLEERGCAPASD